MNKIAVIADSSCDFTPERAKKAGFSVVPLNVTFEDGTMYRDGVDLTSAEFFQKLAASKQLPKTSRPTLEAWMDAFRQYGIMTISSSLPYLPSCQAPSMVQAWHAGCSGRKASVRISIWWIPRRHPQPRQLLLWKPSVWQRKVNPPRKS